MRYAAALLFGLVAADRSYFQKRQDNPIVAIFAQLKPMVEALDQAINAYTGGPGEDVLGQSQKIAATVKQSVPTVNAQPILDITSASGLVVPVQDFTATLQKTIDDLVKHKTVAVSSGLGSKIYANLEDQLSGATALATAIQSKMPSTLTAVAQDLSNGILKVLNGGIDSFKDVATAGAGAGAGAGAAGASSPAPAAAPAPAAGPSTSTSGAAGSVSGNLSPAGGSITIAGSAPGMSSSGMGAMSGSTSGSASYNAAAPQTTSARGSSPAMFTGAGASFKPASVFGLVAVAAAVFAL